jgi:hypothetical protein
MSIEATDAELAAEINRRNCQQNGHLPKYRPEIVEGHDGKAIVIACVCGQKSWTRQDEPMPQFRATTIIITRDGSEWRGMDGQILSATHEQTGLRKGDRITLSDVYMPVKPSDL